MRWLPIFLLAAACGGEDPAPVPRGLLGQTVGSGSLVSPPSGPVTPSIDMLQAWPMHVAVPGAAGAGQFDGADGIWAADLDGDGWEEFLSGGEQGLRMVIGWHPGTTAGGVHRQHWPTTVLPLVPPGANLCSPEDVVTGLIDDDAQLDVLVLCESGPVRETIFFGPAPPNNTRADLMSAANWERVDITNSANPRSMRGLVEDVDDDGLLDLLVGGKESSGPTAAFIGYYSSSTPRDGGSWTWTEIAQVGWVMNISFLDVNDDGIKDVLWGDRDPINATGGAPDNTRRGIRYAAGPDWQPHAVSAADADHKWHSPVDYNGDGRPDVLDCRSSAAFNESQVLINLAGGLGWSPISIPQPAGVGQCQHATMADVDQNGRPDFGFSYSNAGGVSVVAWLKAGGSLDAPTLERGEISGVLSLLDVKADNLVWLDVDHDGDLDAVLTEQHVDTGGGPGLGIVWFENPLITAPAIAAPEAVACSLLASGATTTDASSVQTPELAPAAGAVLYAAVVSANATGPAVAEVTGGGLDWSPTSTTAYAASSARRLTVEQAAAGPAPAPGALTFGFAGQQQSSFAWAVVECLGADEADPTAQVVSTTTGAGTATSATTTLAPIAAGSRALVFTAINLTSVIGQDPQWQELVDLNINAGNSTLQIQTALLSEAVSTFSIASAGSIGLEVQSPP